MSKLLGITGLIVMAGSIVYGNYRDPNTTMPVVVFFIGLVMLFAGAVLPGKVRH